MTKRICVLIVVLALLLCGCGKSTVAETTAATIPPTTEAPTEATAAPTTEAPTEVPTEAPTEEPVIEYRNPLTGEPLAEPHMRRATGVMFNNIEQAMPLRGITSADIVFEAVADCMNVTRMEGIFSDITKAPDLGSVRSSRPYWISVARSFDAIYVHFGGSSAALDLLYSLGYDRMDGLTYDGVYFYRDKDRWNNGYDWEHTAFTSGESIAAFIKSTDTRFELDESPDYGFHFDEDIMTDGEPATDFTVHFGTYAKKTGFVFNEENGLYYASQFGGPIIDEGNGEQLSFRNLVLLYCDQWPDSNLYRMTLDLITEGDADFIRDGHVVPIHWSRASEDSPFVFTYEDGTPVSFGVGHTYIGLIPLNTDIDIQ